MSWHPGSSLHHSTSEQFLPLPPTPLSSQDQTPWHDRSRFSHHTGKGDRSHLRQGQTHRITELSGLEATSGDSTLLGTKDQNRLPCWPIIKKNPKTKCKIKNKKHPNTKLLNYWEFPHYLFREPDTASLLCIYNVLFTSPSGWGGLCAHRSCFLPSSSFFPA